MSHCRHKYKVCGVTVLHCVINISNKYCKHLAIARLFKIKVIIIFEYLLWADVQEHSSILFKKYPSSEHGSSNAIFFLYNRNRKVSEEREMYIIN